MEIRRGFELEFSVDDAEQFGARRLAKLVVNEAYRDAGTLQALRLALASTQSDDFLAQILVDEIQAVRSDSRFYDYRIGHVLADSIDRIRECIIGDLSPRSPRRAAQLLGQLVRLDSHAFEQSDNSDDVIGEVIGQAVIDYGQASAAVPERDIAELALEVLTLFWNDAYGAHEEIIVAFRNALGPAGLDMLESLSRSRSMAAGRVDGNRMASTLQQITTARKLLSASKSAPDAAPDVSSICGENGPSANPGGGVEVS